MTAVLSASLMLSPTCPLLAACSCASHMALSTIMAASLPPSLPACLAGCWVGCALNDLLRHEGAITWGLGLVHGALD